MYMTWYFMTSNDLDIVKSTFARLSVGQTWLFETEPGMTLAATWPDPFMTGLVHVQTGLEIEPVINLFQFKKFTWTWLRFFHPFPSSDQVDRLNQGWPDRGKNGSSELMTKK